MQGFTKYISPDKLDEHQKKQKKCKLRQARHLD